MIEPARRNLIEDLSMRLLKKADALGVLPTPVCQLVVTADAVLRGELNLLAEEPRASLPARLRAGWCQFRRLTDRSPALIYLDLTQLPSSQNLLTLDRLARRFLPAFVSKECQRTDRGTSAVDRLDVTDEEAAYFATQTLFQQNRFDRELAKLDVSLKAGVVLGQLFGSTVHATLSQLVMRSLKRCALLVIEQRSTVSLSTGQPVCLRKDLLLSKRFTTDYGRLCIPYELTTDWLFVQDLLASCVFREDGRTVLNTANGFATFHYHFLSQNGQGFVFIMPDGEWQFSSIRIELLGT